jgi:hypothetical protein
MENRPFSAENIISQLDTALDEVDQSRAREMELAKSLLDEKHKHLEKEKARMEAKYGPNHPEVKKMEARLLYAGEMHQTLDAEIERTKVSPPPMPVTSWRVHGQIFNKDNSAPEGLTVFLTDERYQWVRTLPFAVTDALGYYALTLEQKQITALKDQKLYLGVSTREQRVIYRGTEAFLAEPGVIEYRDLVVNQRGGQEPPGEENPDIEYVIEGKVTATRNKPMPGLIVRAVHVDATGEKPLGKEAVTGRDGSYRISYKAKDFIIEGRETTGADIIIYVHNEQGVQLYKSDVFKSSPSTQTIDIRIDLSGDQPT